MHEVYSYFSFHLPAIQRRISTRKKGCKHISHSPHVSVITGNILITIIRSARYHQVLWNLNEHFYHLTSIKSVICKLNPNYSPFQSLNILPCHITLECLKLTYYSLVAFFFLDISLRLDNFASFFIFTCRCRFTIW